MTEEEFNSALRKAVAHLSATNPLGNNDWQHEGRHLHRCELPLMRKSEAFFRKVNRHLGLKPGEEIHWLYVKTCDEDGSIQSSTHIIRDGNVRNSTRIPNVLDRLSHELREEFLSLLTWDTWEN